MAEHDRTAYDPDQIRVFDGSEDEEESEGSRLPVLIVIALVVLASFAGVVWMAYEKGVASGRGEPKVIMADAATDKPTGDNSGANETQYKGLKIYEQPAPDDAQTAAVEVGTPAKPAPAKPAQVPGVQPDLRAPFTDASTQPQPAAQPAQPAQTKPAQPETKVAALPQAASKPPAQLAPPVETPPQQTAKAESAPPAATASTGGEYLLQIGSYKSEDEANAAWASGKTKHASILAGYSPDVKKVDLGDKGVWYRLRIASFADKGAANDLCDKLKADGGTCLLAK
jgi:cell division protein FtsN